MSRNRTNKKAEAKKKLYYRDGVYWPNKNQYLEAKKEALKKSWKEWQRVRISKGMKVVES